MSEQLSLVKNLKTGKFFILLDELGERYKLINPDGQIVSLLANLFEDDLTIRSLADATSALSEQQVEVYSGIVREQEAKAQAEARVAEIALQKRLDLQRRPNTIPAMTPRPRTPNSSSSRPRAAKVHGGLERTGVAASWSGSTLAFYKPQIERLGPKQSFRVIVQGVGKFVISKQDFGTFFSDVILSPKYKAEGFFAYDEIPNKAMRFLTEPE